MTNEPASGNAPTLPIGTVYEQAIRIEALIRASYDLAFDFGPIQRDTAPPVINLLKLATAEMKVLRQRVSE